MKAKPDLKMKEFSKQYAREACNSGLWTGSRSHPKSPKIEVRDALLDLGFDPTKATKGCLCSCLKVLGFPNYLCVCMVNDVHWM